LRNQPCTCDLPLILLAPEVDETDRLCALQRGADELLRLPLQEVDLVRLRQHVIRSLRIKRLNACGATRDRKMQNATHDLRHQLMNLRLAVSLLEPAVGSDTAEQEVLASMETSLMKMEQVLSTLFPSTPRQLA
jgi:signal transduction histidine kinase